MENESKKNKLQEEVKSLAANCLLNSDVHNGYADKDLENASIVFMHFLLDVSFTNYQHLEEKQMLEIASRTGTALKDLILMATGKDMHEIVKS